MKSFKVSDKFKLIFTIIIDITFIILWYLLLINGGFAFLGKLLDLLLTSPQTLFNLDWGTDWVNNRLAQCFYFFLLFFGTILPTLWLNYTVFIKK